MNKTGFFVVVDNRRLWVNPEEQAVTLFDDKGASVFTETIQVAAGSVQGLFSMLDRTNPVKTA